MTTDKRPSRNENNPPDYPESTARDLSAAKSTSGFSPQTKRAFAFSLIVNLIIISVLGVWYFRPDDSRPNDSSAGAPPAPEDLSAQTEPQPQPEPELKPLPGEKAQDTVTRTFEEKKAAAENRSAEENQQELDQQTDKLNQFSSEESIDQLTRQFQKWLATQSRAVEPQDIPPVTADTVSEDNFDANSAQFHDVRRNKNEATGRYEYQSVLLDAQGRTLIMDLSEEEGKELYKVMQKIKSNPLLDKVYRQILMPILDKELEKIRNRS